EASAGPAAGVQEPKQRAATTTAAAVIPAPPVAGTHRGRRPGTRTPSGRKTAPPPRPGAAPGGTAPVSGIRGVVGSARDVIIVALLSPGLLARAPPAYRPIGLSAYRPIGPRGRT